MRSLRKLVLGFALAVAPIGARPGGCTTKGDDLGSLHREILEILHGEPRLDVSPSPYYCWRHGRGPERPQMRAFDWFVLGEGACSAVYIPDLGAIHSPLSDKGEIVHFFFDDEKYGRLETSLTRLASAVETTPISLGDRFDLQMTLWELIAALQFRRDIRVDWEPEISQPKVDRLLVPALKVLRATLFTRDQVAALPSTLTDLPVLSGEPTIRPLAEQLLSADEAILEDLFPSQLHNAFSQGRLFSRVFITLENPEELERLQESLTKRDNTRLKGFSWRTAPPVPEDELTFGDFRDVRYLPLEYSGLRAVLVLFFNVMTTDYRVVPTELVASWDELWWSKKLEDPEDLRAADRAIGMRIIKYQKQLGLTAGDEAFPRYRSVSQDEAARVIFTDVNPVYPDTEITTVRAHCLTCHSSKLMTYNMHLRKVGFAPPFSVSPEELGGRRTEAEAGESFREWTRQYLEKTEGER